MKKYNSKQRVSVAVLKARINPLYEILEEKRRFGIKTQQFGIYRYGIDLVSLKSISDKNFIQEGDVYLKPRVVYKYSDGQEFVKYFDEESDAYSYAKPEHKVANHEYYP